MKKLVSFFALTLLVTSFATTDVHAQSTTDSTFKPHWSINGQLFADYYYVMAADTFAGKKGSTYYEPNANISGTANSRYYQAFDLRRVQFGANYWFTPNIISKFLLEHESGAAGTTPPTGGGDVLGDAKRGMYVKEASITFVNAIPMANLIFGQQATNVFSVDEGLMGFRSLEKSIIDERGMSEAGSNDLGIQLAGNFDNDKNYGYSALISNGTGAKDETDKYKAFTGEVNAKFMDKHIVVDISGDYMDKANATTTINKDTIKGVAQSNSLLKVAAAYTSSAITGGVVYAMHTLTGQSGTTSGGDAEQTGLSFFIRGQIIEKQLNFFARYDIFDPDSKESTDNALGRKENLLIIAIDWVPDVAAQNVHVMPNFWMDMFKDKSSAGASYESIVVPRLTFSYKF
ncbi:MAG TPA: hypothetical protein VGM92_11910 [Candidatus Kapabacteria bacterium]|jgi:hypothetical protein